MLNWFYIPAFAAVCGGACIFALSHNLKRFQKYMGFTFIFEGLVMLLGGTVFISGHQFYLPTYLLYLLMLLLSPFFYYFATNFLLKEEGVSGKDFWMLEVVAVYTIVYLAVISCIPQADRDSFFNLVRGLPAPHAGTGADVLLTFDTLAYAFFIAEQLFIQIFCMVNLWRYKALLESWFSNLENKSLSGVGVIIGAMALRFLVCIAVSFFPALLGFTSFRIAGTVIFFAFYAVLTVYVCRLEYTAEELSHLIDGKAVRNQPPAASEIIGSRVQLQIAEEFYLDPDINLADFSDRLGVNSKYVSDFLHYTYGETFLAFVNHLRVEHAAKLLSGDLPIVDIAEQSGFVTESTFYRNFKKIKGVNPSQYRDNQR